MKVRSLRKKLAEARDRRSQARKQLAALLPDDDSAELSADALKQANALKASINTIDDEIEDTEAKLELAELAREEEREAPAASSETGRVNVEDNLEKDPLVGFRDEAHWAHTVREASSKSSPRVDPLLAQWQQRHDAILRSGGVDMGAAAPTTYQHVTHSSEGYAAPPQVQTEVDRLLFESDGLIKDFGMQDTEAHTISFNVSEATPWTTSGIQAYWVAEAGQLTESKEDIENRQLILHKVAVLVPVTDEVLNDAPRLRDLVTAVSAERMNWKISDSIFDGTGAGQPLGFANSPSVIEVSKETNQAADTIVPKNITKMRKRALRQRGDNWAWYVNPDVYDELIELKLGNEPSWANNLREGTDGYRLLGDPLIESEHCDTLGDAGDIFYVNRSKRAYKLYRRTPGLKFASSMHLFFDHDTEAFRWTMRVGGLPVLNTAVTPPNSSVTRAHFIRVAARA